MVGYADIEKRRTTQRAWYHRTKAKRGIIKAPKEKYVRWGRSPAKGRTGTAKDKSLWALYRITETDYNLMFQKQGGKCLICEEEKPLQVDHCHTTKKVRGLLCRNCNTAIGKLGESPHVLTRAILYVQGKLVL